ncbi:MAG: serine/threonine protein kinase, partial [Anaerolineaceae bacterium]|nr:serine/threonine protein kinase [Anaerolineaceae bacterium]
MAEYTGKYIGRYHIRESLGQGGMAVVYKAFDTTLERDVAVKFIRTGEIGTNYHDQVMKRFEQEAKSLARFDHPNIITVFDYGQYENVPYLVMQYQPGGTLRDLTGQPMDCRKAVTLVRKLTDGLQYAHNYKVIHRDIKPANVLITKEGEPKLTDFGIAKVLDQTQRVNTLYTPTSVAMGTAQYMAPEQFVNSKVDQRVDIYALGVVLYELVTGRRPYDADTPLAIGIMQKSEPLPSPAEFNPGVESALENVIIKALALDPLHRYQSMQEFGKALQNLLDGHRPEPVPVLPTEIYEETVVDNTEETEPEDFGLDDTPSEELVFETQPDLIAASREEEPQIEIVEEGVVDIPKGKIPKRVWGIGAAG